MEDIESLKGLVSAAKKDKRILKGLKNLAVKAQMFEEATYLRSMEKELFPCSQEQKDAKELSVLLKDLFSMVELNIEESTCWLINETIKLHNEKGGEFSIHDAVGLKFKRKDLFEIE